MSDIKVPEGYKQTEIGVIPEDWELLSVREICDLLTGFPFPSSKYQDSGIRLLRGSNVKRGNTDWDENITRFWSESTSGIEQYLLQKDDIVISMDGSLVGRSFAQLSDSDLPSLLLQRVARLRAKVVSQNYLKEWICSPIFSDYCDSVKTVTAIPHISPADILNFRLLIPQNKKEQIAIATALSDIDNLIQSLEKLIAKKESIKAGTMQQLLTGKTRLPEFATRDDGSKKELKQTELGRIPEDWELLSVREISDLLTGFPFPSSKYQDSGIRLLRGSNVKRGNTDWSDNITKFWADSTIGIEQYILQEGDVVISMDGSLVGRSFAQLSSSDLPALLLQRVARLRTKLISQNYLKEWICSPIFSDYCDSVKTVTAIPHISPADILNFKLLIPQSKKEQTAIATVLSDMDAEIQALQQRLEKTRDIKQGMMKQLLTGKVRLAH